MLLSLKMALAFPQPAAAQSDQREPVKSLLELRRERVVVQEWDLSCGSAALATVLKYQHGDPISEKDIAKGLFSRKEYMANPALVGARQGFSLLDLKRFVDGRGYRGVGFGKLELDDLVRKAPVIVPVRLNGYNHFVVFRGLLRDRVLLADPAWGNRTMRSERFLQAWLEYPQVGKVGFVVEEGGHPPHPNNLAPKPEDYPALQ
ncbi:MAG: C39 family peptidase [Rhodospirillales bacterium]|nr:C39 family peptidase [Rhodospirillales bacterium]